MNLFFGFELFPNHPNESIFNKGNPSYVTLSKKQLCKFRDSLRPKYFEAKVVCDLCIFCVGNTQRSSLVHLDGLGERLRQLLPDLTGVSTTLAPTSNSGSRWKPQWINVARIKTGAMLRNSPMGSALASRTKSWPQCQIALPICAVESQ